MTERRPSIFRRGLWALLVLGAIFPCVAGSQVPERYQAAVRESREIIAKTMAAQSIPGLSVAVSVDGKIIWSEGFGSADLENNLKVTPATRFRIASVSKPITAAAMARLYEQGKLDPDAPVQKYVPEFPSKGVVISARQLVGHLSGIRHLRRDPDPEKDEFFDRKTYCKNVTEGVNRFQADPLEFAPGTKFGYSSKGFVLLSAMLERTSGQEFLDLLQKEVFGPLGMANTGADDNRRIVPNRSRFYSLDTNKNVINAPYIDQSCDWAGGGLLSTADDLARFGSAHLQSGFLKKETLEKMFTSQKTSDGKETGTGWGWRINRDKEGRTYYFHPGENVGGRSYLWAYPKEKVVVAMLHNLTGAHLGTIVEISRAFAAVDRSSGQ
ncbi:MAG: beta-lactamase family protein [Acidobacteria bacterium]|nr:beta-lactamase family protein [Acidobacteriota bacterium]